PEAPGYHVPFAREIRERAGIATAAVGMIRDAEQAEAIIAEGSADLVFLARAMLKDAYWARKAAEKLGAENTVPLPIQYKRAVEGMNRPPRR
ncbi:MAG: oxidoreductase, partial [Pseudomonadota bacterium]|nr:oxidoreductase [Pseudomonadota bacterium]